MSNAMMSMAPGNGVADLAAYGNALEQEGSRLSSGKQYIQFAKGDWVIGREKTSFPENRFMFFVNVMGVAKGWQCWKGGRPVDEVRVPFTAPLPPKGSLTDHGPYPNPDNDGWQEFVSVPMVLIPGCGVRASAEGEFSGSSFGARSAIGGLMTELGKAIKSMQLTADRVALVLACADSYRHATYGKVHTPKFEVLGYYDLVTAEGIREGTMVVNAPAPVQAQVQVPMAPAPAPVQAAPVQAAAVVQHAPAQTAPVQTAPVQTAPVQAAPVVQQAPVAQASPVAAPMAAPAQPPVAAPAQGVDTSDNIPF